MNTSDTLNLAADLIEERGWTRGDGWGTGGEAGPEMCLEGALAAASEIVIVDPVTPSALHRDYFTKFIDCPAYMAVKAHLELSGEWPLWHWNDRGERTATEVVEVLRAAALIAAARERETAAVSA